MDVGESGTLYRFLKFLSWKNKSKKEFILRGTLKDREICDDPAILDYAPAQLLKLDNGTSQWASASYLFKNRVEVSNPPPKLQMTYDAAKQYESDPT